MKVASITAAFADKKKPPQTGQIDYFDRTYPGLALRISCGGRKSWTYTYRAHGKQRRMTLGMYPHMTVAQAHEAWRKARDTVQAGQDPARGATRPAVNFAAVLEEWLQRDQAKNRSIGTVKRSIQNHALPSWQDRPITEIGRRDVLDVIDAVVDKGTPIAARRLHAYLHRLFTWAVGRDIIKFNPLASVDRPAQENKRERVLTDAELVKVWNAADKLGWPYGPAFQLLILTGARREEIGQLRWSEIDGDTIKLEGSRTKNSKAHNIPLSAAACAVLDKLPRIANSEFVFTRSGHAPISSWANAKPDLDDLAGVSDWITHDLRRTCATGLQKLSTPIQVTEAILGHTGGSRGGIVSVYQTHSYDAEKRAALEAWGACVMDLVEGRAPGKVVALVGANA
jgi:integrase